MSLISRGLKQKDKEAVPQLNGNLVRYQLDCCVQLWPLYLKTVVLALESNAFCIEMEKWNRIELDPINLPYLGADLIKICLIIRELAKVEAERHSPQLQSLEQC